MDQYDPFARGRYPVGVRTIELGELARTRVFPFEVWYPAAARHAGEDTALEAQDAYFIPTRDERRRQAAVRDAEAERGSYPLVFFSHSSGSWGRRSATFLCTHLASHGYVVAALDHSEVVAPELQPKPGETSDERAARGQAWIANRVPDVRFALDQLLDGAWHSPASIDAAHVGIAGHSFGGWTVLAAPEHDRRIGAVVALAPAGSSQPKPGILPATLTFAWGRDVPTLYLVAENDTMTPLAGMSELFERTPASKRMFILRNADHSHFLDEIEREHEVVRAMPFTGDLAWIPQEMRPISELCPGDQANAFVRGLTLSHFDATLKQHTGAAHFLEVDVAQSLAARSVDAVVHH